MKVMYPKNLSFLNEISTNFSKSCSFKQNEEVLSLYEKEHPHLIIVDNTQEDDSISLLKKLRGQDSAIDIILISEELKKETIIDIIDLKLTKFFKKPLGKKEFQEYISKYCTQKKEDSQITIDHDYVWNPLSKSLTYQGEYIKLSKSEIIIFSRFCNTTKNYFSLNDILKEVYGEIKEDDENKARMLVKRLRKKTSPDFIKNIYGLGYKFNT